MFVESLPVTGTQKVQGHKIFGDGGFQASSPGLHDLRALKPKTRHDQTTSEATAAR